MAQNDLRSQKSYCPDKSDFNVSNSPKPKKADEEEVMIPNINATGVTCYNYTSKENYTEQTPIIVTMKLRENANMERLNDYLKSNIDDILIN